MNLKSEQLRSDLSLDIEFDDVLPKKQLAKIIISALGNENCHYEKIDGKNLLIYKNNNGINEVILFASVTYLGGKHLIFKKRMQLPNWYKKICLLLKDNPNYNVRFIGVYHYRGHVIFVDFVKDTYLKRKMNNSAAHVYINDLYQGAVYGIFSKIDKNNNTIVTIKYDKFKNYLDNSKDTGSNLLDIFKKFNCGFTFGQWLRAIDVIQEMYYQNWPQWRQTEWAGWFLEYKFATFIKTNKLEKQIKYIGNLQKKEGELDFDLWFNEEYFYGDLKASDINKLETPGNDQENLIECINKYGKFWYIIYEHETIKDRDINQNYEATRFRNRFIKTIDNISDEKYNELSYHSRMKHSVKFMKMTIIELNKINYREILSDFNQGRQPDGKKRKPKFKINKNNIDNFIIFRYNYSA